MYIRPACHCNSSKNKLASCMMYFYSLFVTKLMAGDERKKIKYIFFEIGTPQYK